MKHRILSTSPIQISLLAIALSCCGGCLTPSAGPRLLEKNEFDKWARIYENRLPLNEKEQAKLRVQYVHYLNRINQLKQDTEHELDIYTAGKLTSFPYIVRRLEEACPGLSTISSQNSWIPDFAELAPNFTNYISAKKALKSASYDRALTDIAKCPDSHSGVIELKGFIIEAMLLDFSEKSAELMRRGAYRQLAQKITDMMKLAEKHALELEALEYRDPRFPDYGSYFSELIKTTIDKLEHSATELAKSNLYCQAIDELELAINITVKIVQKDSLQKELSELQLKIRNDGIAWHTERKIEAEDKKDFKSAQNELEALCCLKDERIDCSTEKKRLQTEQFITDAKKKREDGKLLDAINMLQRPPSFSAGNPEVNDLLIIYKDEYGQELIREGDSFLSQSAYGDARAKYLEAQKYLSGQQREHAEQKAIDCDDKEGRSLYPVAARQAAKDCRGATETMKKAIGLVKDKTFAIGMLKEYEACAKKRVVVVLKADDPTLSRNGVKQSMIDAVGATLRQDEYTEVISSNDIPVLPRNKSALEVASQVGADFVVVIDLEKPDYQLIEGPRQVKKFCWAESWIYYSVRLFNYYFTDVIIYQDRAEISLNVRAYLINVPNGVEKQSFSRTIRSSWSKEYWFSSIKPEYLRYCPRGSMLNTPEDTPFLGNTEKFNQNRQFPAGMDLIRDKLYEEMKNIGQYFSPGIR